MVFIPIMRRVNLSNSLTDDHRNSGRPSQRLIERNTRLLAVTNMYPTPHAPAAGTFVEQQIKSLRQIGLHIDVIFVDRARRGVGVYFSLRRQIHARIANFQPDIVHAMYGGVMAYQVIRTVNDRPTVVTFHGSDLLGEHLSGSLRKLMAG